MQNDLSGEVVKVQQRVAACLTYLGRLAVRSSERFAQRQLNGMRLVLEMNRRQVQALAQGLGPRETLHRQRRLAVEMRMKLLEHTCETLEVFLDTQQALSGWLTAETQALIWASPIEAPFRDVFRQ